MKFILMISCFILEISYETYNNFNNHNKSNKPLKVIQLNNNKKLKLYQISTPVSSDFLLVLTKNNMAIDILKSHFYDSDGEYYFHSEITVDQDYVIKIKEFYSEPIDSVFVDFINLNIYIPKDTFELIYSKNKITYGQ